MKHFILAILCFSSLLSSAQVDLEDGLFLYLNFDGDTIKDLSENKSEVQIHGKNAKFGIGENLSETIKIVDDSSAAQVIVKDTIYSASLWVATDVEVDNNQNLWFSALQFYEYGVPNQGNGAGLWVGPSTTLGADEEVTVAVTKNSTNYFPRTMAGNLSLGTEWHHYLINYNGSSYDIFVDGIFQSTYKSTSGDVALQIADNPVIGVRYQIDGEIRTSNTGEIDEVRMYNRPLTQDEILELASSYNNPLEIGLITYLDFDDEIIQDESPLENPVAVIGNAASFGEGNNMSASLSIIDDSTAVQVELEDTLYAASLWVATDIEVDNNQNLWFSALQFYEYGVPNQANGSGLWIGPSTTLGTGEEVTVAVTKNSTNYFPRTMAGDLGLGTEWHHYLINYNGSSYDIFVDGVKQTTFKASNGNVALQHLDNPVIGVRYQSDGEIRTSNTGDLDEIRLYNRALNPNEINHLFESGNFGLITSANSILETENSILYPSILTGENNLSIDAEYEKIQLVSGNGVSLGTFNTIEQISTQSLPQGLIIAKVFLPNGEIVFQKIIKK